ncbi:MAG: response regulator [Alphaproteobacteria bacterium]|nr:response regulator [Alphaproteobacteria bacterium]
MASASDLPLQHISAMVVDDNHHMRTIVNTILRSLGCMDVRECGDGAAAFELLRSRPADIIILDYRMDTLDGLDFVRLLRRAGDSPCPMVPVIMMTGHSERRHVLAARDAGVTEFVAKPISAKALCARIESALMAPRSFVKATAYVGPNRRRRSESTYEGPSRRETDRDDDPPKSPF